MASEPYAGTREAADPYCLAVGEATALLAGHPWRRYAVVGDSVAEGLGDPVDGYVNLPWAERIAVELRRHRPELAYLNLGRRKLRVAQVRAGQLDAALAFAPDLALVSAGANDALLPSYDPDAVDAELVAMIRALQDSGAEVMTVSLVDLANCPAVDPRSRAGVGVRMRTLADHTRALSDRLGTVNVDLSQHPTTVDVSLYSSDGLHGNGRSQAISAAIAIRTLGRRLGNTFRPAPA